MDFYKRLFTLNFLDLYDICHDIPQPTYHSGSRNSRIDTIFVSLNFTSEFLYSYIDQPVLYSSDHKIVFVIFTDCRKQSNARGRTLQNKRQVSNLRAMNPSKWNEFAAHTDFHYRCHNLDRLLNLPTNRCNMNTLWIDIKAAILAANRCVIPQV